MDGNQELYCYFIYLLRFDERFRQRRVPPVAKRMRHGARCFHVQSCVLSTVHYLLTGPLVGVLLLQASLAATDLSFFRP